MRESTDKQSTAQPVDAAMRPTDKRPARTEGESKSERHNMRLYKEDFNMLVYWADRFEMDRTQFLITAMYHYIKWRNQDYDLPSLEIQRLNQLVDAMQSLVVNQANLENTVMNGFDAMLGIIRGDNYLVDADDGTL